MAIVALFTQQEWTLSHQRCCVNAGSCAVTEAAWAYLSGADNGPDSVFRPGSVRETALTRVFPLLCAFALLNGGTLTVLAGAGLVVHQGDVEAGTVFGEDPFTVYAPS